MLTPSGAFALVLLSLPACPALAQQLSARRASVAPSIDGRGDDAAWAPNDLIQLYIDSYHDGRTGFEYVVNPVGVKADFLLFDDDRFDRPSRSGLVSHLGRLEQLTQLPATVRLEGRSPSV